MSMLLSSLWVHKSFVPVDSEGLLLFVSSIHLLFYGVPWSPKTWISWAHPPYGKVVQSLSLSVQCLAVGHCICSYVLQKEASQVISEQNTDLWVYQNIIRNNFINVFLLNMYYHKYTINCNMKMYCLYILLMYFQTTIISFFNRSLGYWLRKGKNDQNTYKLKILK